MLLARAGRRAARATPASGSATPRRFTRARKERSARSATELFLRSPGRSSSRARPMARRGLPSGCLKSSRPIALRGWRSRAGPGSHRARKPKRSGTPSASTTRPTAPFVIEESLQANRPDEPARWLTATASWDAGLASLTSLTDFSGQTTQVIYDRLGRQRGLYRPLCQEPSVVYQYLIRPTEGLHAVRTVTNEVCDRTGTAGALVPEHDPLAHLDTATGIRESYAFVDGLGRARATLTQGDEADGFAWILSEVSELDARGNVRRAYQPVGLAAAADPLTLVKLQDLDALFEETRYDAFGREVWRSTVEGTDAARIVYGANQVHASDGNDLDPASPHAGTFSTTVSDGLGRTVALIERLSAASSAPVQATVTAYDPLGNVVALSRGEASLGSGGELSFASFASFVEGRSTGRRLLYDSLGRRTHSLDPDAGTYRYYYDQVGDIVRTVDSRGVENRYLYDLGGRLIAEDYSSDGAGWAPADPATGHSPDDRADLARLGELALALWTYQLDADNDFVPEAGADVLYGYDAPADPALGLCRASPGAGAVQKYLAGKLSWVRDPSGCSWSSYDERGRTSWSARQVDPGEQVFVSRVSYSSAEGGADDQDRMRSETFPDGSSVHYDYSRRGLLEQVRGDAPAEGSLFKGRTFAEDIRYDEFGQRVSWLVGDARGNQVATSYEYDPRRRLEKLTSVLTSADGGQAAAHSEPFRLRRAREHRAARRPADSGRDGRLVARARDL